MGASQLSTAVRGEHVGNDVSARTGPRHADPRETVPGAGRMQLVTLALVLLASGAVELAVVETAADHTVSAGLAVLCIASGWYANRRTARTPTVASGVKRGSRAVRLRRDDELPPLLIAYLCGILALPFIVFWAMSSPATPVPPLEIQLLAAIRSLALALAMLSKWPFCQRLASLLSLFLIVSAVVLGESHWVMTLAAGYATVGSVWLMLAYWQTLAIDSALGFRGRFPWSAAVVIFAVIGLIVAVAAAGPRRAAAVLAELMPSSGGTGEFNPRSRGGVNDGDEEMRGSEDAMSVGFADSDIFRDTPDKSLYDIVTDFFGEPRLPKDQDRAIALDASPKDDPQRAAINPKAGREFPTTRNQPRERRRPKDRNADALCYVKGPAPAHLRMVIYDLFDGSTWYQAPQPVLRCDLENDDGVWMRFKHAKPQPFYADVVTHEIKIAHLKTERVLAPALLYQFRVGKVNNANFYQWAQDDIVRVAADYMPSTTKVEVESWTIRHDELQQIGYDGTHFPASSALRLPDTQYLSERVRSLAAEWVADVPRGWRQVETIVDRLREQCRLDPDAVVPEDCVDVVDHFVFEGRRGPDYLFASAAAMMLRSLGYPTRVVSGFYVDPDDYDASTEHTPIQTDDQHFWVEVQTPSKVWIPIEPTPGYHLAGTVLPLHERFWLAAVASWDWALVHALELGLFAAGLALVWWQRRRIYDWLATWSWRTVRASEPRQRIVQTLRLVDRRARWAGQPRPRGRTATRWLRELYASEPGDSTSGEAELLLQYADWAVYAPETTDRRSVTADVERLCHRVQARWTLGRFRTLSGRQRAEARGKA